MKYSKHGYKRNSKDRNNPYNVIPSGEITMKGVDFPIYGVDDLGNEKVMMPGAHYTFPGNTVLEVPLHNMQQGGEEQPRMHPFEEWATSQGMDPQQALQMISSNPEGYPPEVIEAAQAYAQELQRQNPINDKQDEMLHEAQQEQSLYQEGDEVPTEPEIYTLGTDELGNIPGEYYNSTGEFKEQPWLSRQGFREELTGPEYPWSFKNEEGYNKWDKEGISEIDYGIKESEKENLLQTYNYLEETGALDYLYDDDEYDQVRNEYSGLDLMEQHLKRIKSLPEDEKTDLLDWDDYDAYSQVAEHHGKDYLGYGEFVDLPVNERFSSFTPSEINEVLYPGLDLEVMKPASGELTYDPLAFLPFPAGAVTGGIAKPILRFADDALKYGKNFFKRIPLKKQADEVAEWMYKYYNHPKRIHSPVIHNQQARWARKFNDINSGHRLESTLPNTMREMMREVTPIPNLMQRINMRVPYNKLIDRNISYGNMFKGVQPGNISNVTRDGLLRDFRKYIPGDPSVMGNSALYQNSYRHLLQDVVGDLGLRKGLDHFAKRWFGSSGVSYRPNISSMPRTSGKFYTQSRQGPSIIKQSPQEIKSTMVHEGDHFFHANNMRMPEIQRAALKSLTTKNKYQGGLGERLYKKLFGKNTTFYKGAKNYYQGVGEINARIMEMRHGMNLMPGQKLSKPALELYMKKNPSLNGMKKWLNVDKTGKFNKDEFLTYFNTYYEEGGEENNPEPTLVTPGTNEYRKAYQDNTLTTYNPEDNSYHFPTLDEVTVTDDLPATPQALREWSRTNDPIAYATREATTEAAPYALALMAPALIGASLPIATAIGTSAPVTAGVGLLDDVAMGLYNSPYVGGAIRNAWNYNPTKIPGLTVGNITNAGFAGHGAANIGPNTGELIEDPSLSNTADVGMNVLEMSPFFGPTTNAIKGGFGVLKNTFKTTGSNASYIDEFLLSEKQLAGITDKMRSSADNLVNPAYTFSIDKTKEINSGYSKVLNEWSSAKGRNRLSETIRDYLTNPYTYNRLNVKPIYNKADDVPQELIDDAIEQFLGAQRNLILQPIDEIGAAGWGGKTGLPRPFLQLNPQLSGDMLDQVIRHEMGHILQGLPAHVNLKKYDPSRYEKLFDYGMIPPHRYQGVGVIDELGGTKNSFGMTYGRQSLAQNIGLTHNQLQMDKDLIAGLKLKPEYQNVLERDIPKDVNFIRGLSLDNTNDRTRGLFQINPLGAGKYFTSGSGKTFGASREPTPFLTELRTAMKNKGYIDDVHQQVTQKDILNFYKNYYNAPSSTLGGSRAIPDIRLLEIMEPSVSNFNFLAETMNKLPATIPLVGAGLMGSDKAGPGYQPGGELEYTPQTQEEVKLNDVKDGEVNTEGLTPYVNYNIPYDIDFHETDVPDYIKLRQSIAESTLDPNAVSEAGATGLTQIMPITLTDYEERTGDTSIDLTNHQDAMKVQDWLMNDLYNADWINKPKQSEMVRMAKTLSAYNWGRTRFNEFLNKQKSNKVDIYGDKMPWIQNLPKETRDYLSKILWDTHPQMTIDYKHVMDRPEKYGVYFDAYNFNYKKGGEQKRQQRLWKEYKKYAKGEKISPIVTKELEDLGLIKSHVIQPNTYYTDDGGEISFADEYSLDDLELSKISRESTSPFSLKQQVGFYQDHINGVYDNSKNFTKSKTLFDKINRLYLLDAKQNNKHVLSYMRSLPKFQNEGEVNNDVITENTETTTDNISPDITGENINYLNNALYNYTEPDSIAINKAQMDNTNVNLNLDSLIEKNPNFNYQNMDDDAFNRAINNVYNDTIDEADWNKTTKNELLFPRAEQSTETNPIYHDEDRNLGAILYYSPRNEHETFFKSDSERMTPYLDETYGAGNYKVVQLPHQAYQPRYTELSDLMFNHPAMLEFKESQAAIRGTYNPQFDTLNEEISALARELGNEHDEDSDNYKRLDKLFKAKNQEIFDLEDIYVKERREHRDNFYDNLETTHPDLFEIRNEYNDNYTGDNRMNKYISAKNIADTHFGDIKNLSRDGKIFFMQHSDSRIGPLTLTESRRDPGKQTPGVVDTFGEILSPESEGGWLADNNQVVCYAGMCGGVEEMRELTEASGVTTIGQPGTWSGYQNASIFPGYNIESQFFNANQEGIINPDFDGGAYVTHTLNDGTVRSDTTGSRPSRYYANTEDIVAGNVTRFPGGIPRNTHQVRRGQLQQNSALDYIEDQEGPTDRGTLMERVLPQRNEMREWLTRDNTEERASSRRRFQPGGEPIRQGTLDAVNVGPGGDAIEFFKARLPYYDTLSSDQRQHLNDVYLGEVSESPIFRNIIGQGREGYGIGNNPTYMESVHDFAGAFPTLAGKNMLETLTIPQATLVEGIEAVRGNPYNFKNVLPTADKNLFSNQRFPSNTFLQDAAPGWQIAGDIGIDPAVIFGLGKLGQLGVRSLRSAARNRKLATTLSSTMDDALTTPTNYNTVSRPASIFDGANPGFGQSDELVDDAYKAIGSIGEDKIYSTSQIGDLTVTNASKNLLTDMSNAANTGKFVNNSFPQIGVAGGKLNVPNKTQITKFDDALNTAFDYKGMEDGTNVALTRVIDSKGLTVENGKLTFKIAPHIQGSKGALKIQNYDDIIKKRNTTHFSFSHIQGDEYHSSHGAGYWKNKSTAVINNINDLKKHGELLNISPSDTYFYNKHNMFVGDQAIVLTRDKKLYDNITKNAPKTNIYYVGKNVTDDQFTEIVNSFHRTAGSSQDMNGLFHNYVGNELVAGRDVGKFKVSNKEHYLKDFSSNNPSTFSGGFAGHDSTHGGSIFSDLEKAANFKNLKYIGPELKSGVDPSGKLPSRQGTITDLSKTYHNPYLMRSYNPPGNIHHQAKLLNKYIPYPEMKESPRIYKNWLKDNAFENLSSYPIEVQINEIQKLASSGFDKKFLNIHKEYLALDNGFDTWTDMVAGSKYSTMKRKGGEVNSLKQY